MPNFVMSYLGSTVTPGEAGNQFWALIYVLIIFTGVSVAVIAMNWIERKALAHFQVRLGPMRVGPHGLLQPFADALKLMLKEDIIPAAADQFVFWVAPLIGLLRQLIVTGPGIHGIRLSRNVVNGAMIEDAYIYRMAA